ncbi:hypothetical protein TNCV_4520411 [Trichonephila clavipes]|nr:hypothetical protein TNCV_4520411 [Trichonephila clavipes]
MPYSEFEPEPTQLQVGCHNHTGWVAMNTIIWYEWTYGTSVPVIHERLQTVYGEEVIYRQMVGRWRCIFRERREYCKGLCGT